MVHILIYVSECAVYKQLFFLSYFDIQCLRFNFLKKKKEKNRKAPEETLQKLQLHIMNEKSHERAPLIVEISDVQDSFRRSELPVSLCGGFPQGTLPLFWMEEAYGRVHHVCALLCFCTGCLPLSLMLLCQEAAHCRHNPAALQLQVLGC